ncbi:hypothetical protein BJX63DRAFT_436811 [Aspergillus granulosus]|uniref:Uncharacterized protein n=1 Tax=Aspergillus granulosus TaxID=176169 RepID=A0ABR4GX38_9EURO
MERWPEFTLPHWDTFTDCLYPILGQARSQMIGGDSSMSTTFLYLVSGEPNITWYDVNKLRKAQQDSRLLVTSASKWNLWSFQNLALGAESGKLLDVGTMWATQRLTGDPFLQEQRLPYAYNFKMALQDTSGGVFHGATLGDYFKNGGFVSKLIWLGNNNEDYVSPIFTTFYALLDVGNILLFDPSDELLLSRFTLAAEKLPSWQKASGEFDIGYLKANTSKNKYPHLTDNCATWYGLAAVYRILGDKKYLDGAEAGAKWFIEKVLETGRWLGVCDDTYLYPDFATVFAAQALLTSTRRLKMNRAHPHAKWNHIQRLATQPNGPEFEHAGYTSTANARGPIYLSSHTGAFIRFYGITGDQVFLDLARYAAKCRDAFVDPTSSVPSYYWYQKNIGGSTDPWHGWWHIGWVTDYLLASAHMLSDGAIYFPYGFITAKVGSHAPYGFASATVLGEDAELWQPRHLLNVSDPEVDYITARREAMNPRGLVPFKVATSGDISALAGSISKISNNNLRVTVAGYGLAVVAIETTLQTDSRGPEFRSFNITGSRVSHVVSWSFWTTAESRVQWAIPGSGVWTSLPSTKNYTFSQSVDLADVENAMDVKIRIASTKEGLSCILDAVFWTL